MGSNIAMDVNSRLESPTVCIQCRYRKKSCNKALPSCARCTRLLAKCSYLDSNDSRAPVLPPIVEVIPGFVGQPGRLLPPTSSWSTLYPTVGKSLGIDDQVSLQAQRLLAAISRRRGPINRFCEAYFGTFHHALPIISKEVFYWQLENNSSDSHFSTLLLSIYLITHLNPQPGSIPAESLEQLYPTLKSIYSLLQSTGKISVQLVQAAVLIASWEHCQALHQDAWLTIGHCIRMGHLLGLHNSVRQPLPKGKGYSPTVELKRCLWWGVVIVERIIIAEHEDNGLPFASGPPDLGDFLPLVPLDDGVSYRVKDDLLLPQNIEAAESGLESRDFTRFGSYAASVQATYLSSLVTTHVLDRAKDPATRESDAAKIDACLQSYGCALIPPPGRSEGFYCGAQGIRTSAAFYLYEHEINMASEVGDAERLAHAIFAIQSATRTITYMLKHSQTGSPINLDALAFFSHRIVYIAAIMHIRFGDRDEEWAVDLETMKYYMRYFEPRYKLYGKYLRDVEATERFHVRN